MSTEQEEKNILILFFLFGEICLLHNVYPRSEWLTSNHLTALLEACTENGRSSGQRDYVGGPN